MDFPYAVEDGIFVLQEDCRPGDDIRPVVGLNDHVVEFEITSNRPDCLSVIGLARESAATFGKELKLHIPQVKGSGGDIKRLLEVEIAAPDFVPAIPPDGRMSGYSVAPLAARAPARSGVRPSNNIVDITN
jgi:phenylalanyl-tRNA synthetase beta chain